MVKSRKKSRQKNKIKKHTNNNKTLCVKGLRFIPVGRTLKRKKKRSPLKHKVFLNFSFHLIYFNNFFFYSDNGNAPSSVFNNL